MLVILEVTEEDTLKNDTGASSKNDTGASAADGLHIEEKESNSLDELVKLMSKNGGEETEDDAISFLHFYNTCYEIKAVEE